ncbi:PHP domain-containing protein, partial [Enterobacter hormaechei]
MYQVDLHAHTIASTHAYSTVNEYFSEAARRGIKLFAITDHGPE